MDNKLAFNMPIYIEKNNNEKLKFFSQTLDSIKKQTDSGWLLIIVDDNSPNKEIYHFIENDMKDFKKQCIYVKNDTNIGPGLSRNKGIDIAYEHNCDLIMFQDADDYAHPFRVERTRQIFDNNEIDVLYSPFIPIDENDEVIDINNVTPSIRDIIIANKTRPLVGKNLWKKIATETGYINLTSATSVRMKYAKSVRFPNYRVSEDAYTWMLYSAYGAYFYYCEDIPCKYRIKQISAGSSSRSAIGKELFYKELCRVNEEAFFKCLEYSEKNGLLKDEDAELSNMFYIRLLKTLISEGIDDGYLIDKIQMKTRDKIYE